ncbi:MAG: SpoIIE family protein phosphatase [Candidatus Kapabacteria bacterium]|nr:SpoIIE family protein phosphatase [Ignavibacteriota bacterium]MCW5884445.1 SpoIIE family protein phosphatase [Candidatus Kapabacteria bacterium]
MDYYYVEITKNQMPKYTGLPCGDVIEVIRNENETLLIIADGKGSGIKANIAANTCVSRIAGLLSRGFSLRNCCEKVAATMENAIKEDLPYSVFLIARFKSDGYVNILSYEMPPSIIISNRQANILTQRKIISEISIISESSCYLKPHEGIILYSDGVTQAGLGVNFDYGWGVDNICKFINSNLHKKATIKQLPKIITDKSFELSDLKRSDDVTTISASLRLGVIVNLLTGPPEDKSLTKEKLMTFLNSRGIKLICGATSARLVADILKKPVKIENSSYDGITPPASTIDGINLVTEGLVTLNQLFNIMDEDREDMDDANPVTQLYDYLMIADRVNIFMGSAINPANNDISYKQRGLIPRAKIISLISQKLTEIGKLVVINRI